MARSLGCDVAGDARKKHPSRNGRSEYKRRKCDRYRRGLREENEEGCSVARNGKEREEIAEESRRSIIRRDVSYGGTGFSRIARSDSQHPLRMDALELLNSR